MVPAASMGGHIMNAAFDSSFVMPPLLELDESAKPVTAQQREGWYHMDGGYLELKADDTRLVAKLTGQSIFDLILNHTEEQKKRFADLNARNRIAMNKMQASQKDALSGLIPADGDAVALTAPFLRRIKQIGDLASLHVVGTFANTPGSRFHDSGPWTTFVYAEFENWNQYWNLVWSDDEEFSADLQGPWPSFTLISTDKNSYVGVMKGGNWRTVKLDIQNDCVIIMKSKACKE